MRFNLEPGKRVWPQIRRHLPHYLMLLPVLVWLFIFCYIPMSGLLIAFVDFNPLLGLDATGKNPNFIRGILRSEWVGFKWFIYIFRNPEFLNALKNTLLINLYNLIFSFPAPLILALLLNECRAVLYKRVVQTVSYLPHFVSWAIIGGLLNSLLSPSKGIINQVITMLGSESIYFMGEPSWTRTIFVTSGIWKGIGWGSILYLAALTSISQELYESAMLDGAGKLKQIRHITLPGISYLITMQLIFWVAGFLEVGFEQAFNIVNPATYSTGMVTNLYIYRNSFIQLKFSYPTAAGLLFSVIGMTLMIIANNATRKINPDGAIW